MKRTVISSSTVKRIIREEVLRATPVKPGQLMSEQRAHYLAEETLNEIGILSKMKAFFAGGAAGAKELGAPFAKAAASVTQSVANAGKAALQAVKSTADNAIQSMQAAAIQSMSKDFQNLIKKKTADMIAYLVKKGKTEDEAKDMVAIQIVPVLQAALAKDMQPQA
jgi:hypothetical protein